MTKHSFSCRYCKPKNINPSFTKWSLSPTFIHRIQINLGLSPPAQQLIFGSPVSHCHQTDRKFSFAFHRLDISNRNGNGRIPAKVDGYSVIEAVSPFYNSIYSPSDPESSEKFITRSVANICCDSSGLDPIATCSPQ
jgi:hypothetical protein